MGIAGGFFNLLGTMAELEQQQKMIDMYNRQWNRIQGMGAGLQQRVMPEVRYAAAEQVPLTRLAANRAVADAQEIERGYEDRYRKAMAMLEGMGEQERRDIARSYRSLRGQQQAELTGRGFSGTTVGANLRAGTMREERDALGRLESTLRQQRIGTHGAYSGDILSARQATAATAALGREAVQQAKYGARMTPVGYDVDLTGMRMGYMAQREYPYPTANPLGSFGQSLMYLGSSKIAADAAKPESPSWYEQVLGHAGGEVASSWIPHGPWG